MLGRAGLPSTRRCRTCATRSADCGRSPGFAAVATLTLALGIGANTAIFSVVCAMLLAAAVPRFVAADVRLVGHVVRQIIAKLDPQLPAYDLRLLDEYVAGARAAQRFATILAAAFAIVALALAAVGVYGVIAYATTRRRYEFGVRIALGARPGQVMALVIREGAVLAAIGLTLGVAGAALAARLLQSQLFGVTPRDAVSYATAVVAIALAAMTACWLPARRISAVTPLEALRSE